MPIRSISLIESIKRAVLTALVVIVTNALAGCVAVPPEVANWTRPEKPTDLPQEIVPVQDDFICKGIWPCQKQFAAIVASGIAQGDIAVNHSQTYVCDNSLATFPVQDKRFTHSEVVTSVVNNYGSGAEVMQLPCTHQGQTRSSFSKVPQAPFPTIVNFSIRDAFGYIGITFDLVQRNNAIMVQIAGNADSDEPTHCRLSECWYIHNQVVQTGRLIMVAGHPYGGFSRCGKTKDYCIIAKSTGVVTNLGGKYSTAVNGSSFAAPQVTAALQLLSAMWPYLSQEELVQLLFALAIDQGKPGVDVVWGRGKLSFWKLFTPDGVMGFKCNNVTCVDTNTYS